MSIVSAELVTAQAFVAKAEALHTQQLDALVVDVAALKDMVARAAASMPPTTPPTVPPVSSALPAPAGKPSYASAARSSVPTGTTQPPRKPRRTSRDLSQTSQQRACFEISGRDPDVLALAASPRIKLAEAISALGRKGGGGKQAGVAGLVDGPKKAPALPCAGLGHKGGGGERLR
jgi:hypothetical protein